MYQKSGNSVVQKNSLVRINLEKKNSGYLTSYRVFKWADLEKELLEY